MHPARSLFFLAPFLLPGCSGKKESTALLPVNPPELFAPRPADPGKVAWNRALTLRLPSPLSTMNPLFVKNRLAGCVAGLVYDSLFGVGPRMEFLVNPALVEDFKESENGLVFRVRLKKGLKWQDGAPFTAEDVLFSFSLLRDSRVPVRLLKAGLQLVRETRAPDSRTFLMEFRKPSPANKWNLLFPVLPAHLWGPVRKKDPTLRRSREARALDRAAVGNGPYKLVRFLPEEEVVLERWPGYPGERPAFERITWKVVPDRNAALLAFRAGRLDALQVPNPSDFLALRKDPALAGKAVLARGDTWTYQFVAWNVSGRNPFFLDRRVRLAMAFSLDRKWAVRELFHGLFRPCAGPFHPSSPAADPQVRPFPYDPARAASLLDQAGWKRGPAGWRRRTCFLREGKSGREWFLEPARGARPRVCSFSFQLLLPAGSSATTNLALRWRDALAKLGVEAKLLALEKSAFLDRLFSHAFDASFMAWGPGVDPYTSEDIFGSRGWPDGKNLGGFRDPLLDSLYARAAAERNPEMRMSLYRAVFRRIHREQPYLFLWFFPDLWVVRSDLRGLSFGPRGALGFTPGLMGWWAAAPGGGK